MRKAGFILLLCGGILAVAPVSLMLPFSLMIVFGIFDVFSILFSFSIPTTFVFGILTCVFAKQIEKGHIFITFGLVLLAFSLAFSSLVIFFTLDIISADIISFLAIFMFSISMLITTGGILYYIVHKKERKTKPNV